MMSGVGRPSTSSGSSARRSSHEGMHTGALCPHWKTRVFRIRGGLIIISGGETCVLSGDMTLSLGCIARRVVRRPLAL